MIVLILSVILFLIFGVLSAIHFYWLFGGKWGVGKVFPTKSNTASNIKIPKFATLIVALGLLSFGLLYLLKSELISVEIPNWILRYAYWIIPSIFIIRAIGEFNYVGFFKKVKDTEFGKADSKIFSPLCLLIGVMGILVQLIKI